MLHWSLVCFHDVLPHTLPPHLKDHLCTRHAFHHYLGVAGRCLAQHLGAYGGQIQQDCLQGVSVKEELETETRAHENSMNFFEHNNHVIVRIHTWLKMCLKLMTHNAAQTKLQDRLAQIFTYLFSSHHADRFTSEQVVDKFGNERTEEKTKRK